MTKKKEYTTKIPFSAQDLLPTKDRVQWIPPLTKDATNIFYYSFNAPKIGDLSKMAQRLNKKAIVIIRDIITKIPSFANVRLIEVDDLNKVSTKERKFSIMEAPAGLLPPPLKYEQVEKSLRNPELISFSAMSATTLSFKTDNRGQAQPVLPLSGKNIDTKFILIQNNILEAGETYLTDVFVHELFHGFGLEHPCENIANSQKIKPKDMIAFQERCESEVSRKSIMQAKKIKLTGCIQEHARTHTQDTTKIAFETCMGYRHEKREIYPADKKALELLLGKVATSKKPQLPAKPLLHHQATAATKESWTNYLYSSLGATGAAACAMGSWMQKSIGNGNTLLIQQEASQAQCYNHEAWIGGIILSGLVLAFTIPLVIKVSQEKDSKNADDNKIKEHIGKTR